MRDEEKQLRIAKLKSELPLEIRLSVTVSDGSFEGSLSCPVSGGPQAFERTAKAWMKMLHEALLLTQESAGGRETTTDTELRTKPK